MMHAHAHAKALRGHAMPFPKTKTPPLLGREDNARKSAMHTHTHFFSPSTPLLHNCLALHDGVLLEIAETVDRL